MYVAVYNRKYDRTLGSKADVLRAFAKLDTPLEHDKYLEALHCEYNLHLPTIYEVRGKDRNRTLVLLFLLLLCFKTLSPKANVS